MEIGGKYNWINQPERLVYLGRSEEIWQSAWYQFALVEDPEIVWCEILHQDLDKLEETVQSDR